MISNDIYHETQSEKTLKFIEKANIKHNYRYDYSMVDYKMANRYVTIKCSEHGSFLQRASNHLSGQGCKKCVQESIRSTTKIFIRKANIKHDNKYDYSVVDYKHSRENVIIICPLHGKFIQTPNQHMKGSGCRKCMYDTIHRSTTEDFIEKANIKHNHKYDYSMVDYKHSKEYITIICSTHGKFIQTPNLHLTGSGCISCAKTGFDINEEGTLYYIKFESDTQILYKIGITNLKVKQRLTSMGINKNFKTTILQELFFESGSDALYMEKSILQEFKNFQYKGDPIMKSGNSELFIKDVLKLDIESEICSINAI